MIVFFLFLGHKSCLEKYSHVIEKMHSNESGDQCAICCTNYSHINICIHEKKKNEERESEAKIERE